MCEPPPGHEASVIANTLVETLPQIAGISDPAAQRSMIRHVYPVSRRLLEDELADQLRLPRQWTAGLLRWLR